MSLLGCLRWIGWLLEKKKEVPLEAPLWALPLVHQAQVGSWPILTLPRKHWMRRAGKSSKVRWLQSTLKKEREFHRGILANYEDETVQNMEETRYRMHPSRYKQKIRQCEILLAHPGSIQILKTIPPSLASSVESTISPTPCSGQVSSQHTREMGQPSTAKWNTCQVDELAAMQQITQLLPPTSCTTPGSISLMDSDDTSVVGSHRGYSSIMT